MSVYKKLYFSQQTMWPANQSTKYLEMVARQTASFGAVTLHFLPLSSIEALNAPKPISVFFYPKILSNCRIWRKHPVSPASTQNLQLSSFVAKRYLCFLCKVEQSYKFLSSELEASSNGCLGLSYGRSFCLSVKKIVLKRGILI